MKANRSISVECKKKFNNKLPILSPLARVSPEQLASIALPKWLLKRSDFKQTLQEKLLIKNFDFSQDFDPQALDRRIIKNYLKKFLFFKNLQKSKGLEILEKISVKMMKKGEILPFGFVFLVIKGNLLVLSELRIGPLNVLNDYQYPGQAIIENDASLFTIPSEFYENLTYHSRHSELKEIIEILETLELFNNLKSIQSSMIAQKSFLLDYPKDFYIYEIGENSQFFYILIEGECELSSLITLRASNFIPSSKTLREEVKFETRFTKFKEKITAGQVFGLRDALSSKKRESHVRVVSNQAKVIALHWKDVESLLKNSQVERIKQLINFENSQEFGRSVAKKLKVFKKKFNALLQASDIKKRPLGRDVFDDLKKRKKLYIEALENSHRVNLREINFNLPGRNVSSFY
jgi:CRP-like cAMP-binding protein